MSRVDGAPRVNRRSRRHAANRRGSWPAGGGAIVGIAAGRSIDARTYSGQVINGDDIATDQSPPHLLVRSVRGRTSS